MRSQQVCPQCDTYVTVPAIDALVCPGCGTVNAVVDGVLTKPTEQQLDQLLCRPDVRRVIEQASAIRQALFGGQFTLADPTSLLEPQSFPTLAAAISKANTAPWTVTAWIVIDPSGHIAAHRTPRKDRPA
ncbi:hypothetical protein SEA_VERITY_60 [Gordonia phage Verity]|uniref:Uncharacterized protein n=1 Tax=Gordonia phage Verity TaxID=2591211 RepID=A0A514DIV4_9CAUD|nr:hypothetical protein J1776_gp60 [Gordonia phage Verity]QDH93546.1 hypothetical protein SEA_VERITY_60 [Gordonia phage Verity]QPO16903.1 hypothetical protein SEA_DELREY21_60 [Gordonia phage Delrey21]QXN74186.1 hypothetical protein SEA_DOCTORFROGGO_60 [Gordonia phage DoctorFroggo]